MITLIRAHNSFGLDCIKDHIHGTPTRTGYDFYMHFKALFMERPDEVFMLLALDDYDMPHGFIFAARHETQPYVWLYQGWSDKQMSHELNQTALDRLQIWTQEACGLDEIRIETLHRSHRGFESYGFNKYSVIYNMILGRIIMGDSGSEPEVQSQPTIRPSQAALIDTGSEIIEGRMGEGATPYDGQMVADPSDISSEAFANYGNFDSFGTMQDTLNSGWSDPTYTYDPDQVTDMWRKGYANPMLATFQEETVPYLEEGFAGDLYSTKKNEFVADRTKEFYGSTIAPTLFNAQQQAQQWGIQSAEAGKGREAQALDMPFKQVQQSLAVGAAETAQAQKVLDAAYQEFLRTADEQDPWLQLGAQYGGITTMETVGMQGSAGTDYAQMGASLGAAGMMSYATMAASDRNYKMNIIPIESALDKVAMLGGYTYDFVPEIPQAAEGRTGGIMAQDLEQVMPETVHEIDGIKHVSYGAVIGLLVNAVNELKQKLEEK